MLSLGLIADDTIIAIVNTGTKADISYLPFVALFITFVIFVIDTSSFYDYILNPSKMPSIPYDEMCKLNHDVTLLLMI